MDKLQIQLSRIKRKKEKRKKGYDLTFCDSHGS